MRMHVLARESDLEAFHEKTADTSASLVVALHMMLTAWATQREAFRASNAAAEEHAMAVNWPQPLDGVHLVIAVVEVLAARGATWTPFEWNELRYACSGGSLVEVFGLLIGAIEATPRPWLAETTRRLIESARSTRTDTDASSKRKAAEEDPAERERRELLARERPAPWAPPRTVDSLAGRAPTFEIAIGGIRGPKGVAGAPSEPKRLGCDLTHELQPLSTGRYIYLPDDVPGLTLDPVHLRSPNRMESRGYQRPRVLAESAEKQVPERAGYIYPALLYPFFGRPKFADPPGRPSSGFSARVRCVPVMTAMLT